MSRVTNIPSEIKITAQQRDEAEEELREQQKPIDYNIQLKYLSKSIQMD